MELSDFTGLLLAAMLIAAPLGSIYFVIRKIGNSSRGLFLDAFLVWLAWTASNLWIYLIFAIVDSNIRLSFMIPGFSLLVLLLGFVGSTVAVAVLMHYLLKRNAEPDTSIIWQKQPAPTIKLSALRISFTVVASATLTFLLFAGVLAAAMKIYNYCYPPPPPSAFGIYDI